MTPWPIRYFTSILACFATSFHSTTSFLMKAANSLRRTGDDLYGLRLDQLGRVGIFQRLDDLGVESLDDCRRGACGCHDAVPGDRVEAGITALGDGRQVGRDWRALLAGDAERDQGAASDLRQPRKRDRRTPRTCPAIRSATASEVPR